MTRCLLTNGPSAATLNWPAVAFGPPIVALKKGRDGPPTRISGWKLGSWGLKGPPRVRGDDEKGG